MNTDVNLKIENTIQNKHEITVSVNVSIKKLEKFAYMKKIMFGILTYVILTAKSIARLLNA